MQHYWTANQRKFIEWLAQPKYTRTPPTQELLAKDIGVHRVTLSKWAKKDGLQDAVTERARALLESNLPDVYGALTVKAISGDVPAIKLILELCGRYVPGQKVELASEKPFTISWDVAEAD